jgi:hypothetical protein
MKRQMHPSRELVLKAIRRYPEITVSRIASATGLTKNAVQNHVQQLLAEDLIHSVKLPQSPGRLRTSMNGYHYGSNPEPAVVSSEPAPAQWDVLAHFFGRIAVPEAA